MRITSRAKTIAFFIALGACLVALAVFLNVSWIVFHQRSTWLLVLGIIFFSVIIIGLVVNTIFIVREIKRNERQDTFLNAVTHELKTPIASIRLYLETLQSRPVDEAQRHDFYRIMIEDSERLLGTVEQVLKAGEVRHGTKRRNWQEVNLTSIVSDTLELARLRHHLPEETLRFGVRPNGELLVMGNPEELRTAVFNLFDNAVKYSGTEKDIIVDVVTPDLDTIALSVRDRGIGIAGPELKRIFNRFYRVPSPASGQVKGTGLGLFIVRSIARRYGGDAFAESQGEGLGSTFTIRLPRVYRT
jgi:two-component system, OmpR family, sensor histidine kinase SenX3